MTRTFKSVVAMAVTMICLPTLASAQINFPKNGYYVAMGTTSPPGKARCP